MTSDILQLSAPAILRLYEKKQLSPVEVTQAALKQVLKYNPAMNALCFMDEKAALHQARVSEKRWYKGTPNGVLEGLPVTIKDWFHVKGWPTRMGSRIVPPLPQRDDSPPVARLRESGAIFIGKTTLPEFGHKGVTDSLLCGATRNPWNLQKTPGGSSGGAAVAAATGMGWLNLGSDAGGSIRIPASFTGVFGFKPSPGMVPSFPPSLFSTLSALGPLTRCVEDAALMLDVLTRHDDRDWHALPLPPPRFMATLSAKLPALRIAYAPAINGVTATPAVRKALEGKLKVLRQLGTVDEIKLDAPGLIDVFNKHWMAVAAHIVKDMPQKIRKDLDPRFMNWAQRGRALHLNDYLDAERARMDIGAYFKNILTSYDILVTPATAMQAFDCGVNMPNDARGNPWEDWTPFTYPANLAKLPAAVLPAAMTKDGLPAGLQVMAGYLRDDLLMQVCHRLEKALAFTPWLQTQEAEGGKKKRA
ncbi:MAG: amidase [Alphaproteobacteria bacterium]|nr:amidase [Alphaproteobacteria bacterium]